VYTRAACIYTQRESRAITELYRFACLKAKTFVIKSAESKESERRAGWWASDASGH
jgi:hypothetical protein